MGEHGFRIGRKRKVARKESVKKVFRGADKGSTQLMSPLGNEEALRMVEKAVAGSFKMGVGGVSVSECVSKMTMEVFAFIVIPFVHGVGTHRKDLHFPVITAPFAQTFPLHHFTHLHDLDWSLPGKHPKLEED
jgi:hypothetical protein